ncbi:MAG: PD-(D/E)XK nuclease family transposase [Agathobacter sp.]|nr:PD-(D/E)XK nuclease family transposase [Agathobacter sp.]
MLTKEKLTLKDILGDPISREEAYDIICSSPIALAQFYGLSAEHQEDILAFIQGNKGLPILYDGFYKYVLDPERHPERLESFLSELFGQQVTIEQVLTKEGIQLSEVGTLVVMDIIVRLSDGSIVDVEMQKHGYLFTGERSSCYMSDMVMRQYNRVRDREKERFKFSQMKPVYLIILMENSTKEFKEVAPIFIHRMHCAMDSGVKLNLLTNLVYISLDTFHSVSQNIDSNIEAWLTFLSSDKPEDIMKLVEKYPEFKDCYRDIIMFRKRPEELMNMFSEALIQMDKNTVKYMIEEQQKEIEENKRLLEESQRELEENKKELEESQKRLAESEAVIAEKDAVIAALQAEFAAQGLKIKE